MNEKDGRCEKMFEKMLGSLGKKKIDTRSKSYKCSICGHDFEAEKEPERCPNCRTDAWDITNVSWKRVGIHVK